MVRFIIRTACVPYLPFQSLRNADVPDDASATPAAL